MILVDVGVWLAIVWRGHDYSRQVASWFDQQQGDSLLFCRVTQTSILRLLSNRSVMGEDVMTRSAAWEAVEYVQADDRVAWVDEPATLEPVWKAISARDDISHKLWTDDYLAAFAQAVGLTLATLDKRISGRYPSVHVETLI